MSKMSVSQLPRLKLSPASMEKVDRLGWAVGFSLKSYGVRIGVRSNDEAALARVYEYLPRQWENLSVPVVDRVYSILVRGAGSRASVRRTSQLYADGVRLTRSADLDEVFERLESDLRLFVAEYARHRVFVHAGVVGWKGKAIVIPGRSYSGKSSLVAELVRAGATYYSDEYAVFDARGRVHPFSKPLELRESGDSKQSRFDVTHFGGKNGTKPLPVGLVVMTRFQEDANWRPRKLSPGKGALEILFNTVSARRAPERALATLQRVVAQADVLKGVRGEASATVPALLKKIERSVNGQR